MVQLAVQGIRKAFRNPTAAGDSLLVLDGITFSVSTGEFVGLIGPSGCGKTTLLRIIAGLVRPDEGRCLLDGSAIVGPRSDIAMVFQLFNLFPWRTVLRNVEFGLEMLRVGTQERRERVMKLLTMVGLAGFEHYYPHQLSGGMQQRVGVARALALSPSVLLMDEPFGALDYQAAERLRGEMLRIHAQTEKATLIVTHNIDEVLYLCDRVVVLSARPAHNITEVVPNFPKPRWEHDIQAMPEFGRLRTKVKNLVMGE